MNIRWSVSTPSLKEHGKLAWQYDGFSGCICGPGWRFPANGSGRAGVFCGSLFCCLNYDAPRRVELYQRHPRSLALQPGDRARTSSADLRGNPSMYTVEMRLRGTGVRVFRLLLYPALYGRQPAVFSGYAGYRSDNTTVCELLRLGDA
ncbi:MAG: hypothetical protein ACLTLQ_10650 [[Clostridium] scindens]